MISNNVIRESFICANVCGTREEIVVLLNSCGSPVEGTQFIAMIQKLVTIMNILYIYVMLNGPP